MGDKITFYITLHPDLILADSTGLDPSGVHAGHQRHGRPHPPPRGLGVSTIQKLIMTKHDNEILYSKFYNRHDNEAAVEVLYHASNSELNDGDGDGQTPLLMAVKEGHYNSVKVLLSLGADIANRFVSIYISLQTTEVHLRSRFDSGTLY